jgi:hypothetical protein
MRQIDREIEICRRRQLGREQSADSRMLTSNLTSIACRTQVLQDQVLGFLGFPRQPHDHHAAGSASTGVINVGFLHQFAPLPDSGLSFIEPPGVGFVPIPGVEELPLTWPASRACRCHRAALP